MKTKRTPTYARRNTDTQYTCCAAIDPWPPERIAHPGDYVFIPFNHWHLVFTSSVKINTEDDIDDDNEGEEEAAMAVNFWGMPKNTTASKKLSSGVFRADTYGWGNDDAEVHDYRKEAANGGGGGGACVAEVEEGDGGSGGGVFDNVIAQGKRLATALKKEPECVVMARDEPAATFTPELLDIEFLNSRGGSSTMSHQPSGTPLNKHGYAQSTNLEDVRHFAGWMESAYSLCQVDLEETPPGGNMRNAADKTGRLKALKKWRKRLETMVMCTGAGVGGGEGGAAGVGSGESGSGATPRGGASWRRRRGLGVGRRRRVKVPDEVVEAAVEGRLLKVNMWTSHGVETSSGLHFDNYENYLLVLSGVKRALMFPPSQTKFLYRLKNGENCDRIPPPLSDDPKLEMGEMLGQINTNGKAHNYNAERDKAKESMNMFDYGL